MMRYWIIFFLFISIQKPEAQDSLSTFTLSQLDSIFNSNKKPEIKLTFALEMLKRGEKELNTEDTAFAKILFNLGNTYTHLKNYDSAIVCFEKSIKIWKNKKPVHVIHSNNLHNMGLNYYYKGNYISAKKYWLETLSLRKELFGDVHQEYAISLNNLGNLYMNTGEFDKAEECHSNAIEIRKKVLGDEHPDYASSISSLGSVYVKKGDYKKALPYYLQAISIRKKVLGEESPVYAQSLSNTGVLYKSMGDYQKSLDYYLESLKIKKKIIGEENSEYAAGLNNLGILYSEMGDNKKAEDCFIQALNIRKKVLGENHPEYAMSLNNLGNHYSRIGEYQKEEIYYTQALNIRKKVLGEEHPEYASSLTNMGNLCLNVGDFSKAEHYYLQSESIIKKVLGEEHPTYANNLNNLGSLYLNMKNFSKAEEYYLKAMNLRKKVKGDNDIEYAASLSNLGTFYGSTHDYTQAEKYFLKSLEIIKNNWGEEQHEYALSAYNLGSAYQKMKDNTKAEYYIQTALNVRKKYAGEEHPDYILAVLKFGNFYNSLGEFKKANEYYSTCFNLKTKDLSKNFTWLPEKGKAAYWQKEKFFFEDLNEFASVAKETIPESSELAYNANLISKGLLLESSREIMDAVSQSDDSTTQIVYNTLKEKRRLINHLVSSGRGNQEIIERYEAEADSLDKILVKRLGEYAKSRRKFEINWKDVRNSLRDNEAAIEFARFMNQDDSLYYYQAMILKKDYKYPKLVNLGLESKINSIAPELGFIELYKLVWEPFDSLLKDVKTIYYSPAAHLNNIAFSALCSQGSEEVVASNDSQRGKVGKNRSKLSNCVYLRDRYNLHQLSTTRYLAEGLNQTKTASTILVFGGINYDMIPTGRDSMVESTVSEDYAVIENISRSSANQQKMEYLPGTKVESESLQKILKKKKWTVKAYSDVNASENVIKSELTKNPKAVLHIATHGFAFPEPDKKMKDLDNPMARCGLMFSGSNYSWLGKSDTMFARTGEDGILTAAEVSNLNLRETKLVVLSACETGLGKIDGSEGTFGLNRGFKLAGVEQIVVSLWSVPDKETMELMEKFYAELSVNHDAVLSFDTAQKQMRNNYPERPDLWAGFVLVR